ncbi:glycosyltransferase [Hyphococcus sp.]|uniref:glycosyltransferase n=1 Tax=Hyphococcus sp. TaxID=2038636 RepID=UPI00208A00E3|nr:MAG: glycosyl transferase family 1 [Marinicaulis sp.]
MQILFLHDNFPAQFGVFGQYLARMGWDVWYGTQRKGASLDGLKTFAYAPHRDVTEKIHPYVGGFERAVLNGQSLARAALKLKTKGLNPDIVMAHSGWGNGLFVKDVWPRAAYVAYFEWYYRSSAPDIVFMQEGKRELDDDLRSRSRNAPILMDLANCDAALCPTEFQKSQFPPCFHNKITVMHDGIDVERYKPLEGAKLVLPDLDLSHVDEIITYVARGMEPYRGFPEFMKALEIVLAQRPDAHAVILGEDRVAYGKKLSEGDSFKKRALAELDIDWSRVHFTGLAPRPHYLQVLQASSVHVYLTVPFVLSWSMMEAMSAGCAIVSSDVDPVSEMTGSEAPTLLQVDHRNPGAVAAGVKKLLDDRAQAKVLGESARKFIYESYAAQELYARKAEWLRGIHTEVSA